MTPVTDSAGFFAYPGATPNVNESEIMKANIGSLDRAIRLLLAAGLFSLFFILPGQQKWLALIGIVPLATGLVRWWPLYAVFGIRSCQS